MRVRAYDLSLRQLYYQLVSQNIVPNSEKSYKNVGVLVSDARLDGSIDWNMIKDRGREMTNNPHWKNEADFMDSVARQFRFDLWSDQKCYVEVMVEKQALEGVLEPVCRKWDVPFTSNKGYSSSSAMYEAGERFLEKMRDDKKCHIIYLGDHDPSGIDMSRDIGWRINLFSGQSYERMKQIEDDGEDINWLISDGLMEGVSVHRIALNMDQITELNPPENPAKITDSRANSYISKFGVSSWELDAIEPRRLSSLVSDAIEGLVDIDLFKKNEKKMMSGRNKLLKFSKTLEK